MSRLDEKLAPIARTNLGKPLRSILPSTESMKFSKANDAIAVLLKPPRLSSRRKLGRAILANRIRAVVVDAAGYSPSENSRSTLFAATCIINSANARTVICRSRGRVPPLEGISNVRTDRIRSEVDFQPTGPNSDLSRSTRETFTTFSRSLLRNEP